MYSFVCVLAMSVLDSAVLAASIDCHGAAAESRQ